MSSKFSYWENNTFLNNNDLIVVGSGIVGLNAAIQYKANHPTHKVLVLEKGTLPNGASTKNAGFACFGSPSELLEDLNNTSEEEVFTLVEKRWQGLNALRNLLGDNNIDFQNNYGLELFTQDNYNLLEHSSNKL